MEEDKKDFSAKQISIVALVLAAIFAFLNSTGAVWTSEFWRTFVLHLIVYGAISQLAAAVVMGFLGKKR